jgi:hypothetical protein
VLPENAKGLVDASVVELVDLERRSARIAESERRASMRISPREAALDEVLDVRPCAM